MKTRKKQSIRWLSWILFLPLICCLNCKQTAKIKVATYNIYFLDDGISPERKANLQQVIRILDADIIGFQEIDNPSALRNILPPNYEIAMIDDPSEVQELALAVRSPLQVVSAEYVYPDKSLDNAFPRSRDLLQVTVQAYGKRLICFVHHAKSRSGGRLTTDSRREAAAELMVKHIRMKHADGLVVLLGDFNDNPDDRSLNILEYGDPSAAAGLDGEPDTFLFNTSEALAARDLCSYGYNYLFESVDQDTFDLTVKGARDENNKWRGKQYDYFEDVKIKAILFDQILLSLNLKPTVAGTGVLNHRLAVVGEPSRIRFEEDGVRYTNRGSLASDHVPVWAVLDLTKIPD